VTVSLSVCRSVALSLCLSAFLSLFLSGEGDRGEKGMEGRRGTEGGTTRKRGMDEEEEGRREGQGERGETETETASKSDIRVVSRFCAPRGRDRPCLRVVTVSIKGHNYSMSQVIPTPAALWEGG
jgi:hypothetical protein